MNSIDLLTEKAKLAANEILALRKKNQHLVTELDLIRRDLSRQNRALHDNERFRKERQQLRQKLEKINKKLEKLMENEDNVQEKVTEAVAMVQENPQHEQLN